MIAVAPDTGAPDGFSSRVRRQLAGWQDPQLVEWSCAAAEALEAQLREFDGVSHRELVDPIATWLSFDEDEREGMGSALDLLQVAFDLADNLADAEDDARQGRTFSRAYAPIPHAVRHCLAAYLVATSQQQLARHFARRPSALRDAGRAIHEVLGFLVLGQGTEDKARKARLVSGAQARLLCLPIWLNPEHPALTEATRARLLDWAEAWGTSWELGFEYEEKRSLESRSLWVQSIRNARERWPDFGPFVAGGPLAADLHLVAVC